MTGGERADRIPPAVAAVGLALLWLGPGLFGHDPWKPDEAYTFGLVLHILQTGDWVVPTLAGEPFLEKPPVFFLTAALFAHLFGGWLALHDAARLATAFYMGLAFAFVVLAARRLHGRDAGWAALLLLAGSIGLVDRGHQLITDTAQMAGFAIALYGLSVSLRRPLGGGLALGTGAGLGFLAKGLLAPGCLGVVALVLPVLSPPWRTAGYFRALMVAALAASPWMLIWPAALYARGPQMFEEWLWGLNVGSFIGEDSIAQKPSPYFYLWVLPWFALPAWPLAALALWNAGSAIRQRAEAMLPLVFSGVLFLVLSISRTGRELYLMPALPALCLLAAGALPSVPERVVERCWRTGLVVLALVAGGMWLVWLSVDFGLSTGIRNMLLRRQPDYVPEVNFPVIAAGVVYTALVLALVWSFRRQAARPLAVWIGIVAIGWGLTMILLLRYVDTAKSYRVMMADLSRNLPASYDCVSSRGLGEPQRALLHYFANIITVREERYPSCSQLLVQGLRKAIAVPDAGWRMVWEGRRSGDAKELYRLYQRNADAGRGQHDNSPAR